MLVVLFALLAATTCAASTSISFAAMYGNNMVLQAAPQVAKVWGYVNGTSEIPAVVLVLSGNGPPASFVANVSQIGPTAWTWSALLSPQENSTIATTLVATEVSSKAFKELTNVLWGEVFVCSGQSNMAFLVENAFNGTVLVHDANLYPHIRLFTASKVTAATPQSDYFVKVEEPWAVASNVSITMDPKHGQLSSEERLRDDNWLYFSAVCWLFGRNIHVAKNGVPVGLISANWGGSPVEEWSTPDSLATCQVNATGQCTMYNAMIAPLHNTTIRGVVWYQGEANSADDNYDCTFPAMIDAWRDRWSALSPDFPFGFVQLAGYVASQSDDLQFPATRYRQTASYGFVPNSRLDNTFMAVAYDLGDAASPFGSVHPRYKEDVGARLALAGRAVIYGDDVYYSGPIMDSLTAVAPMDSDAAVAGTVFTVTFRSLGPAGLELRSTTGWEACLETCDPNNATGWHPATVKAHDTATVTLTSSIVAAKWLRFSWTSFPCNYTQCGLYSSDLPAPPFYGHIFC